MVRKMMIAFHSFESQGRSWLNLGKTVLVQSEKCNVMPLQCVDMYLTCVYFEAHWPTLRWSVFYPLSQDIKNSLR